MLVPFILIPAIIGVLCAIFGYLMGKSSVKIEDGSDPSSIKADLDACRSNATNLSSKIERLEHELYEIKSSTPAAKSSPETANKAVVRKKKTKKTESSGFDKTSAKAILGKSVKEDDLKIIEGIGPKIAELFQAEGINTWKDLSKTTVEKCQEILKKAGNRYAINNPGTWPRQAKLLADGNWAEFKKWTDQLDGGKE